MNFNFKINNEIVTFFICSSCSLLIGALIFVLTYGIQIINPTNTEWILAQGSDIVLNQIGWIFYRDTPINFPLCTFNNLSYPYQTSLMNTDSIPILAVFFKCFSKFLPKNFQYIGLYGLMCFMMQSFLGMIICKSFIKTNNAEANLIAILCGSLFALIPVVFLTLFWHSSSASIWLILLGLIPIFYYSKLTFKVKLLIFILLGIFSAGISSYFAAIGVLISFSYFIYGSLNKELKNSLIIFFSYIISCVTCTFCFGGFHQKVVLYNEDLYSQVLQNAFNINGFFNPYWFSNIFKELPTHYEQSMVGYSYLGIGIFLLIISAILMFLINKKTILDKKLLITISILVLLSTIIALSPRVTFFNFVIFEITYPEIIKKILSIYRCSGRFIWISQYIILILSIALLLKNTKSKIVILIISSCILIQTYDLMGFNEITKMYKNNNPKYESLLKSNLWNNLAEYNNIKVIHTEPSLQYYTEKVTRYAAWVQYSLALYAHKNNMVLNNFYFARRPLSNIEETYHYNLSHPKDSDLFFFLEEFNDLSILKKSDLKYFYKIDSFYLGSIIPLKGIESAKISKENI